MMDGWMDGWAKVQASCAGGDAVAVLREIGDETLRIAGLKQSDCRAASSLQVDSIAPST